MFIKHERILTMKVAYFFVTPQGEKLAKKIQSKLQGDLFGKENLKENFALAFKKYDGLICIMAAGIVVRMVAPYLEHKTKDPAIVVVDQKGQYAVSLLSGHLGGANQLAKEIAVIIGGLAVITTATDIEKQIAFDVYAAENELQIENIKELKYISGSIVQGKVIEIYCWNEAEKRKIKNYCEQNNFEMARLQFVDQPNEITTECGIFISPYLMLGEEHSKKQKFNCKHLLVLRPMVLTLGIGCKKNRNSDGVREAVEETLKKLEMSSLSLKQVATIPRKAQEIAVQELILQYKIPLHLIEEEQIANLDLAALHIQQSQFVKQTVGVASVSTACAYLASNGGNILVDKAKFSGFTLALVLLV